MNVGASKLLTLLTRLVLGICLYFSFSVTAQADCLSELRKLSLYFSNEHSQLPRWKKIGNLFEVREISSGLYQIYFPDRTQLAPTLMRFQEFNDSPGFRHKIFSREEFQAWYEKKKGVWDYFSWTGFNFPGSTFGPFVDGRFTNLTPAEQAFVDYFGPKLQKGENFYLIASPAKNAAPVNYHEIAHALFYLDPHYRDQVKAVLARLDLRELRAMLGSRSFLYHRDVKLDESHAYLLFELDTLEYMGVSYKGKMKAIRELRNLFIDAVFRNQVQFDFSTLLESMEPSPIT